MRNRLDELKNKKDIDGEDQEAKISGLGLVDRFLAIRALILFFGD